VDLLEAKDSIGTRHPWEQARAAFFSRVILDAFPKRRRVRFLDVGCGDGWFAGQLLAKLPRGSGGVGWDIALDEQEIRSLDAPRGLSFTSIAPADPFDLLICLDVIEHVEDDSTFLRDLVRRNLVSGGMLLCGVPAWPILFSRHDVELKHVRRYTPQSCAQRLQDAGLHIIRSGGLFHSLLPVRCWQKLLWRCKDLPGDRMVTGLGQWRGSPAVTLLLTALLQAESVVSWVAAQANLNIPGLSWWSLCQKP
jgi:SAM-dependent methyltransferase